MYMLVAFLSNTLLMGAVCAGKLSRGGFETPAHDASLKVVLGVTTNCDPVLRLVVSLKSVGSQTVKQVG
jgi:hypothetical protein